MKHGSLFSGIGGFDLAAEWMEWENIFHCELMPFPRKILNYYWPNAISYEDICTTDFSIHRGQIDILTGGFPCQPYSVAGKQLGKADERHLFPEMLRAIKEIQPRWIVGENVRGIVSWGGGLVFNEVCDDLEREGYEVQSFLIPAAGVNAPHRRDRIWFVAHSQGERRGRIREQVKKEGTRYSDELFGEQCGISSHEWNASNSDINIGCKERMHKDKSEKTERHIGSFNAWQIWKTWENFPTVSPICNGDDGLSNRLDSITFSKWRRESIKGGGNAIVPQVVLQIFKAIQEYDRQNSPASNR